MNAVIIAVLVMVGLSLARVSVVLALVVGALVGGLVGGLSIEDTLAAFNDGVGGGAKVALAYATLGAFAVAISRSGLPDLLARRLITLLGQESSASRQATVKYLLLGSVLLVAVSSQNLIPVHIAFIPILIPPLLKVMNQLRMDRRAVACALTFGLTAPYMLLPVGFGAIFLNDILLANINQAGESLGLEIGRAMVPMAMGVPVAGMFLGLLVAVFLSYRKPRDYSEAELTHHAHGHEAGDTEEPRALGLIMSVVAIVAALGIQLYTGSMILGGLVGFSLLSMGGIFRWREADDLFTSGMRMMALIGFIMISASGFAAVMTATGDIESLVSASVEVIGDNRGLAALLMLLVGLFITLGIGSSFSTIPIIAAIFVPLAVQFGFSDLATVALVGTAAALGDAGSPASDSTLGPTSGLNVDRQHDHIWDSVVPTFVHYNIPLVAFGWLAAMTL
ncbi:MULTISPECIES: Na+/H+ antiporter family protein [Halomonas]|uniref:Na+/H+ antiporter family protein n=1 Tax=Halomonas TaxID=2745 RepID=UPI001A903F63|nr:MULTISPECIES: Na+/H+ antiporter family protein [Halomonas]MED5296336.1 Na+/H+ antiporter family protein [Pseudomonadota bacterium]MBN8410966.1 Na+/H+ antiporter family protein [Halomonas litopenaei]MBY5925447.1 Na+/H+ antiporter family protein [Halomonas sp. DP4Y7-2]MBY5930414.1 Na+/H+ antiporter family protein [Halomonas sp. DP8Y7-3]MBY5985142.1 Na+/H+ antiporter family protein [Halomonas sp. DP5Y7-2]